MSMATYQPFPIPLPPYLLPTTAAESRTSSSQHLTAGRPWGELSPGRRVRLVGACWVNYLLLYNRGGPLSTWPFCFPPVMLWCGDVTPQYRSHFAEREAVASLGILTQALPLWSCPSHLGTTCLVLKSTREWMFLWLKPLPAGLPVTCRWKYPELIMVSAEGWKNMPCVHHKYSRN